MPVEPEGAAQGRRPPLPPLCLVSDADRVGEEPFLDALAAAAAGGLRWVLIREPRWTAERARDLAERARDALRSGSRGEPCFLLIARRPVVAFSLEAEGVHVPGPDLSRIILARAIVGPGRLVGYSAHTPREVAEARSLGADYIFYSPVFRPLSKTSSLRPVGLDGLEEACRTSSIPVFALGGILPGHAAELRGRGAAGAAMIGGLLDVPDPREAASLFLDGWGAGAREA